MNSPSIVFQTVSPRAVFAQAQLDEMVKENNLLRDAFAEAGLFGNSSAETIDFPMKIMEVSCNFSLQPIDNEDLEGMSSGSRYPKCVLMGSGCVFTGRCERALLRPFHQLQKIQNIKKASGIGHVNLILYPCSTNQNGDLASE